jgi:hypothetical protein
MSAAAWTSASLIATRGVQLLSSTSLDPDELSMGWLV